LGAGTTEAVVVVTPMEVVKIRLQAQQHSLADPLEAPRYRNAGHAVYTIVREEGVSALYRGVSLTAIRQATNQGTTSAFKLVTVLALSLGRCARSKFYRIPRN
jgi:solute carrier family 25 (mitochondrial citrate transporter), member 1